MDKYDGAEAFIEVLNAYGVEHIFFNPGGEQGALLATIAKYRLLGKPCPRLILCLDESVALTAAHGHYMISGRPQFVMVHSELGTLQLGGALHNAQWGRVPVILWAGAQAVGQRVNWKGEPYDQGMSMRNCVKWDYTIQSGENIHDVLGKAFDIAFTEPCGPVYLCFPRDLITEKIDRAALTEFSKSAVSKAPPVDAATLEKVAATLIEAENPLIVAGYTGRYPESVAKLVELAETLCAPVMTGPVYMNFPTEHPLCAGIEQIMGSKSRNPAILSEADVILAIDYDVPYVPAPGAPKAEANIIQFDIDPLTAGRPLWGRGANTYIDADSRQVIPALTAAIRNKLTPEKTAQLKERYTRLETGHIKLREQQRQEALNMAQQRPISPDWVCHCINELIDEETILLHHTISHFASATEQIPRTRPGTQMTCPAGSIQWALGAALGAKVAAPDKLVVSIMSDGGYVWSAPVASLWPAVSYKAPFLSVIMNNQSYGFIKLLVERSYGEGSIPDRMAFEAGVDIAPPADYAAIAEACGAWGRTVTDPDDVLPVLKEAIKHVRNGRPAVVDMRLERDVRSVM
ncbi:thiamine pyrophosphate-requiring protein [Chloroflexota bacterium]